MEKPKTLSVDWKTEGTDDKLAYVLQCTDPDYQELRVSVPADSVTERAARALLIEKAFEKAREMGVDETRLRFHV